MTKDNEWIRTHFEELVNRYAGRYIAVVNGKLVAVGNSGLGIEKRARQKYPKYQPSILKVPRQEDFNCVLSN